MTRHILKTAVVQTYKRRLVTVILVNICNALKEIKGSQSCIATAKKYSVAKNTVSHWLKKQAEIFDAVEENNVSKRGKKDCNIRRVGLRQEELVGL